METTGRPTLSQQRIHADDLQWTLTSTPQLETIPSRADYLADLSAAELLDYVVDLREDAAALRRTLHAALRTVANLTTRLRQSGHTTARLRDELRAYRQAA